MKEAAQKIRDLQDDQEKDKKKLRDTEEKNRELEIELKEARDALEAVPKKKKKSILRKIKDKLPVSFLPSILN